MAASLPISYPARKSDTYANLTYQVEKLLNFEADLLANLANIVAVLHRAFDFYWTGFYLRRDSDLVLGPFQGEVGATRVAVAPSPRGIPGSAALQCITLIVPNVEEFDGHITRNPLSRSEIAVPLVARGRAEMVLNIGSADLAGFDTFDQAGLENIIRLIERRYFR